MSAVSHLPCQPISFNWDWNPAKRRNLQNDKVVNQQKKVVMFLSRRWEHVSCTYVIHRGTSLRGHCCITRLILKSVLKEISAIEKNMMYQPKYNKHLKSESFFRPLLMEVVIKCLCLGRSKLPLKLAWTASSRKLMVTILQVCSNTKLHQLQMSKIH